MVKQYRDIKARHKDAILFFRLGDFYEMFFEDATQASSILDLVLTSRGSDGSGKIPMCDVPYRASDNYIAKLIKAGKKVAICEQIEDAALAQGIVKRDVIRIVSAGTYLDESTDSRYLLAINMRHPRLPSPIKGEEFKNKALSRAPASVWHEDPRHSQRWTKCAVVLTDTRSCSPHLKK
jgi:DNA mismatch repair ATPase MutS